ncbi:MAG TPA: ATP-binding protein [Dongiaceae bacterium]|nr:ATP-binding protein [Dongiaceae bacterium]
MPLTSVKPEIESAVRDLKTIDVFADLSDDDLRWLADHMEEARLEAGEVYGRAGDPLDYMSILLEGEMQFERVSEPGTPVFIVEAGEVTGLLPFSRLTHFSGTSRAITDSRALRLHRRHFPDMLHRIPVLGQRLVALMSDRIRETTRIETQRDKLMALGKLSAGLAHELNNPAAAAQRAAKSLYEAMGNVRDASLRLLQHPLSNEQRQAVFNFEREITLRVAAKDQKPQDPLELSDREAALTAQLEEHNIKEAWKIAGPLAEACANAEKMDELRAMVGDAVMGDALSRVAAVVTIFGLIQEIENSTKRISDLVGAIKRYSYMDQAPMQEVDIPEDLENTLKIFGHWLKKGITVKRDYEEGLPKVCAYGSELNQVWTNLIDNAIDAMNGQGELRIQACAALDSVAVLIGDNGPGIPESIQSRIFEPFFTTKPVGEGTGLGLDTVYRIVAKHHGRVEVNSKPGNTEFIVHLPLKQPKADSHHGGAAGEKQEKT